MTKKLLFITTRLFWPTDSGRKLSLYYYCKGLHDKYNCDIYIYSFLENGQSATDVEKKPIFIKEIKLAMPILSKEKIKNLLCKTMVKRQWPIQCSLYYSKENKQQIEHYCMQIKPDYIFTDMIRTAMYYTAFNTVPALKVLDMDDLLSVRYERQLHSQYNSNVSGQYSGQLPRFIRKVIVNRFVKNLVLTIEKILMKKAELYYAHLYDKVIFVSKAETSYLNERLPQKAVTIPVGINSLKSDQLNLLPEKNMLSFVGNLKVAANIDSLKWIVEDILPKINHKVKLLVIGKCPDYLRKQYQNNKNIIFTGRVNDLAAYVRRSQIFLSPLLYGTGIKTKILEAMAMGVPVVTNNVGAEGLDVQNRREFWVEDTPEAIAAKVDELLDDYRLALTVANRAKKVVEEKYDWNEIWKQFACVLMTNHMDKLK